MMPANVLLRNHWRLAQMAGLGGFFAGFAYTMETGKPLFVGERSAQGLVYQGQLFNDYRVRIAVKGDEQ